MTVSIDPPIPRRGRGVTRGRVSQLMTNVPATTTSSVFNPTTGSNQTSGISTTTGHKSTFAAMRRGSSPELLSLSNAAAPFFESNPLAHNYAAPGGMIGQGGAGGRPDVAPYAAALSAAAAYSTAWATHNQPNAWWPSGENSWLSDAAARAAVLQSNSTSGVSPALSTLSSSIATSGVSHNSPLPPTNPPSISPLSQLGASYSPYFPTNFGPFLQVPSSLGMPPLTAASIVHPNARLADGLSAGGPPLGAGGGRIRTTGVSRSPRYTSRSSHSTVRACECPNCQALALQGLTVDKKSEKHNCHIPGCQKVYGKPSHLKAHLRWHSSSRPSVFQQNRRNGELSHGTALSSSAV